MSKTKKLCCLLYFIISVIALIVCWRENLYYFFAPFNGLGNFVNDTMVNPASRSITFDIIFFFLSASLWMATESKKLGIKYVYLYVIFGVLIAISVTFPLFLIARELKLSTLRNEV